MFLRERDAEQWLSVVESELLRGEWIDPWLSEVELVDFGQRWIKEHALEPRSRDDYEGMFRDHVEPHLGALAVGEISTATVRHWRTTLLDGGMTGNRAAKVHRLLRAILDTAVDDGMVERTPCRTKGADRETGSSRPVGTVAPDVRPGRRCTAPVPRARPARRAHWPAVGRAGRPPAVEHRYRGWRRPRDAHAERAR